MSKNKPTPVSALRSLPSVDQLVKAISEGATNNLGLERITRLARVVIGQMREELRSNGAANATRDTLFEQAIKRLSELCKADRIAGVRRVINATGVILHTNLGRAPLSDAAKNAIVEAARYCTLEYDTLTGSRGRRGERVEDLMK